MRSLRRLAVGNQALAILALDFLVDMFNDEIEQVSRVHVYGTQSSRTGFWLRRSSSSVNLRLSVFSSWSYSLSRALNLHLSESGLS